ncbi:MAG: Putative HTH-type transcriptional regulator [Flavobacteriales bacterium]|nr:MAG: Putative HTH-type transcriptional regulator [Flavobacteriales bacterium]|tara:strand:- start:116 stop:529 length:414 start_codon:yes stop_codon:yes gene_type:complete
MISNKCKYAIKALTYIARNDDGTKAVMTSDIAQEQDIPRKFLEIILRDLRNNRILESKRGKDGGFRLLRPAEDINLTEIMRIIDGPIAMLPCVSLNYYRSCDDCDEKECEVKGVFEQVRDRTLEVLNGKTIKSLTLD